MKTRARFLFEHYQQNLNLLRKTNPQFVIKPDRYDVIICPLCFNKYFTQDDINSGLLTAEHAPPHKLGGKVNTLTCRDCNNTHGTSLDSHLIKYIHHVDALSGNTSTFVDVKVTSTSVHGEIRAIFHANGNNWELFAIPKASNQKNIESLTNAFLSNDDDVEFTVQFFPINERKTSLGLIRSAYLLAFQNLGYSFLLNFNLVRLRYQLQNPNEDIYPTKSVIFPFDCDNKFLGVNILSNQSGIKCYFVVFDISSNKQITHRVGVMLPGPNYSDYKLFEEIDSLRDEKIKLSHFSIDFNEKINTPNLAHLIWEYVK